MIISEGTEHLFIIISLASGRAHHYTMICEIRGAFLRHVLLPLASPTLMAAASHARTRRCTASMRFCAFFTSMASASSLSEVAAACGGVSVDTRYGWAAGRYMFAWYLDGRDDLKLCADRGDAFAEVQQVRLSIRITPTHTYRHTHTHTHTHTNLQPLVRTSLGHLTSQLHNLPPLLGDTL